MTYPHLFRAAPVGGTFEYCGNVYRKRSTRTAEIIQSRGYDTAASRWYLHSSYSGVWGYFPQDQRVNQECHWWTARGAEISQTSAITGESK